MDYRSYLLLTLLVFLCGCVEEETDICKYSTNQGNASVEQMIDGELAIRGHGVYVNTSSKQSVVYKDPGENTTWSWEIQIHLDQENACRFGKIAQKGFYGPDDLRNRCVDTFINRPLNTTLLISKPLYLKLYYASGSNPSAAKDILWKDSALFFLEKRARMPVVIYDPNDLDETRANLSRYLEMGYTNVRITEDVKDIPMEAADLSTGTIMRIERKNISGKDLVSWLKETTGLVNSAIINIDTRGECIYAAQMAGYADNKNDAEEEMAKIACALPHKDVDRKRIYR
jgi:hypothetical protein